MTLSTVLKDHRNEATGKCPAGAVHIVILVSQLVDKSKRTSFGEKDGMFSEHCCTIKFHSLSVCCAAFWDEANMQMWGVNTED